MTKDMVRAKVQFTSGSDACAAWHYRGTSGACVVMAGGFAVTKEAATDAFATRFHQARHQRVGAMLRFSGRGALDAIGGAVGRPPRLVPLAGEPGTVAVLTTPDAQDAGLALNPDHRYPDWQQQVAGQVRAAPGLVFAGPSCSPGALPVARSGLRPGPIRASRAGDASREASAER